MKLNNPVNGFICKKYPNGDVTQWFGENPDLYKNICVAPGQCLSAHNGVDIVRAHGTPIYSVCNAKVVEIKDNAGGYGRHIRTLGGGYEWIYGHLSRIDVSIGQIIKAGDQIGLMGNTGFVVSGATPYWSANPFAGTHLHLGRRKFTEYKGTGLWTITYQSGDKGTIDNYSNGYLGSVSIGQEDFVETTPQPIDSSLTVKSLLNYADSIQTTNPAQANIVRSVANLLKAFGH